MKTIVERRTIRNFTDEQIKPEELEQILQAGLWAPSAGGRQSLVMLVCQNKDINERIGQTNRSLY